MLFYIAGGYRVPFIVELTHTHIHTYTHVHTHTYTHTSHIVMLYNIGGCCFVWKKKNKS